MQEYYNLIKEHSDVSDPTPESSAAWIRFPDAAVAGSNNTAVAAYAKEKRVLCATVFEFDEATGAWSNQLEVRTKRTAEMVGR